MNIAYLIVAHDNPAHLQRLIKALSSEKSAVFIHIDRKSKFNDFFIKGHNIIKGNNIVWLEDRVPVYWGDFSQVEATLALIRLGLADERRFDYFVLLSGTHYPLRTGVAIEQFFDRNDGAEFIRLGRTASDALLFDRLSFYRTRPTDRALARIACAVGRTFRLRLRRDYNRVFGDLVPHGGSQWWALSREACTYVQHFVANETRVVDFFKHTRCPDESFFQTILANSPYAAKIKTSLTYTDWDIGASSPRFLKKSHIADLSAASLTSGEPYRPGEVLFARKFSDSSEEIVAELDALNKKRDS